MELPHLGKHCSRPNCNKLDFLPIKCDACLKIYCNEHYFYTNHNCQNSYRKNNQVPACPLCNQPIPVGRGQEPDVVVGAHIDNDCQADPAKNRRKVFTNKCSLKGCKLKEVVPLVCNECTMNFCLKHRHPQDHKCQGHEGARRKITVDAALSRQRQQQNRINSYENTIHGNLSEDEALARALALSMQDNSNNVNKIRSQEELDLALARQLQASESQTAVGGSRGIRDTCNLS